ncbi:hypothetical protein SAMN05216367_0073 [Tardiphaga sp. OK245]|nr:hypothetical protein SAMN05216367_0073 [Tardiphaga sp. OK245]
MFFRNFNRRGGLDALKDQADGENICPASLGVESGQLAHAVIGRLGVLPEKCSTVGSRGEYTMKLNHVRVLSAAVFLLFASNCYAQGVATIEIYKTTVQDVCGSRSYAEANSCRGLTARRFDELQRRGRLQLLYQTDVIPPDKRSFSEQLIMDSRTISELTSGTSIWAALMVVKWSGRSPRSITVSRDDRDGNSLADPTAYNQPPENKRFFYHFPYEQVSRVVLTMEARIPNYRITYHP